MLKSIKHKDLTWIKIEDPDQEDILFLKEKFDFHPLVMEEFTTPSQRPRAEEFDNCLYIVAHVPLFDPSKRVTTPGELDILVTKDHIITSHKGENYPLDMIFQEAEKDDTVKEKFMQESTGLTLYYILDKLLMSCFPKIDHINENLNEIEKNIFGGSEREMVKEVSIVKRDILAFRRTLKPQRSILESLTQKKYKLLDSDLDQYFQELIGTNIRVWNALENSKELIESLEKTNSSLVSFSINEAMRFLTAISLITFTLSVITGIFAMTPFAQFAAANQRSTFWIVVLAMSLITLLFLLFFRRRRWL